MKPFCEFLWVAWLRANCGALCSPFWVGDHRRVCCGFTVHPKGDLGTTLRVTGDTRRLNTHVFHRKWCWLAARHHALRYYTIKALQCYSITVLKYYSITVLQYYSNIVVSLLYCYTTFLTLLLLVIIIVNSSSIYYY